MNSKIRYTDEELEFGEIVEDFLPPPSQLIAKQKKVTITIELTEEKLQLIESEAKKKQLSYSSLIESILNDYTQQVG